MAYQRGPDRQSDAENLVAVHQLSFGFYRRWKSKSHVAAGRSPQHTIPYSG